MTDPNIQQGAKPQYTVPPQNVVPPGYGVHPQYGAPPQPGVPFVPPKRKKPKWPWIVGGVVVLIVVVAAVAGGGGGNDANTAASTAPAAPTGVNEKTTTKRASPAPGLNTAARDGKFEFVVTGVEPGLQSVGDNPYLTEEAQGQFVIVSMTVQNTSDEPKGFSPSDQKLFDSQGRSFEPSPTAQIALGGSDIPVWDNINPGNKVNVKIVYDMPKNAVPASIELHDSAFAGGVKVSLK